LIADAVTGSARVGFKAGNTLVDRNERQERIERELERQVL